MVTVDTSQPGPKLESLTHIDTAKFTQSELHSLSLCSSATFDLHSTDDLVIPDIDPSLFNESAGSRRQIFSRPRSSAPGTRPRLPKLSPSDDSHREENTSIVNFLKQLIDDSQNQNQNQNQKHDLNQNLDQNSNSVTDNSKQIVVYDQGKSKRKRKSKDKVVVQVDEATEFEVLNVNGVAVDFTVLGAADDLYGAELRRRTAGTETEEEGLGFFRGLEGQWCSRRKKRRIVDASMFGDWLPVGWKLVLALRRRDGRFSVFCRTYMSPSGQQFPSCKDVAYYLLSHYGFSDSNLPMDQGIARIKHTNKIECGSHAGSIHKPSDINHNTISSSPMPISLLSDAHRKEEVSLLDIDNLPEVQVHDTFECHNCNMNFDEKEAYMQHLMSFHQKTTRRFRLGSSVGKGVIIKDGKFECQFCHKEFLERRRYSCHVGIHVRNNVRKSQKMPGQGTVQKSVQPPTQEAVPCSTSKLDALLQVAENSFLETSSVEQDDKHNGGSSPDLLNNGKTVATGFGHDLSLGSLPHSKADFMPDRSFDQDLNNSNSKCIMPVESSVKIVPENGKSKATVCIDSAKQTKLPKMGHTGNSELAIDCGSKHVKISSDILADPIEQHTKESLLPCRATKQSLHCNPAFVIVPEEERVCDAQQKIDSVMRSEEPRLDEVGPMTGQGLQSLPDVSNYLATNATVQEGFNSFVNPESEAVMLDMSSRHQIPSICVWCRSEFYHEAINLEALSDSVGFMCPKCKADISGHLDSRLSLNSSCFGSV